MAVFCALFIVKCQNQATRHANQMFSSLFFSLLSAGLWIFLRNYWHQPGGESKANGKKVHCFLEMTIFHLFYLMAEKYGIVFLTSFFGGLFIQSA